LLRACVRPLHVGRTACSAVASPLSAAVARGHGAAVGNEAAVSPPQPSAKAALAGARPGRARSRGTTLRRTSLRPTEGEAPHCEGRRPTADTAAATARATSVRLPAPHVCVCVCVGGCMRMCACVCAGAGVCACKILITDKCTMAFKKWREKGESFRVDRYRCIKGRCLHQIMSAKTKVTKTKTALKQET
jgi:hypothetical protein